jgi:CheY-like chemotaxis protein
MSQSVQASILLVDDDDPVREVTAAILEDLGYGVAEAGGGAAALDMLERGLRADLLMVDYSMPGMNGAVLAQEIRRRWPALPVLLVTGYADKAALEAVGEERVVLKPFRNEDLARKIRTALGAGENGKVVALRR